MWKSDMKETGRKGKERRNNKFQKANERNGWCEQSTDQFSK